MQTHNLSISLNFKTALILFSALIFFGIISAFIYTGTLFSYEIRDLRQVLARMNDDIQYKDLQWDLSLLNSDPLLPGGESHYIIAKDGYVIERWRPIDGLLDTANLQHILQFTAPQTVTTPSNESWRVVSAPLRENTDTIGAVFVSRHMGEEDNLEVADRRLQIDLALALRSIRIEDGQIDVSQLDLRETQYDISVKVVDRYNQILAKTNNSNAIERAPSYIDTSYLKEFLYGKSPYVYWSGKTPYLVMAEPVRSQKSETVGVIVVARSQEKLLNATAQYLTTLLAGSGIILLIFWAWAKKRLAGEEVHAILFDPQNFLLNIGKEKIEIPEDTHQFHIVSTLFSDPKKEWSAEEIAKTFDEDSEQNIWRRVYDAMLVVNRKVEEHIPDKLIVIRNKKFVINKKYQSKISPHQ